MQLTPDQSHYNKDYVQAIIAFIIVGLGFPFLIGIAIYLFVVSQVSYGMGIVTLLGSIISAITGYYFGNKAGSAQTQNLINNHQTTLQAKDQSINLLSQNLTHLNDIHNQLISSHQGLLNNILHLLPANNNNGNPP